MAGEEGREGGETVSKGAIKVATSAMNVMNGTPNIIRLLSYLLAYEDVVSNTNVSMLFFSSVPSRLCVRFNVFV